MTKSCNFLRLLKPNNNPSDVRQEIIIRTDSIEYISCAVGDVFIQYKASNGDTLTFIENYDSEKIAFERFFMILEILGAEAQKNLGKYSKSINGVKYEGEK